MLIKFFHGVHVHTGTLCTCKWSANHSTNVRALVWHCDDQPFMDNQSVNKPIKVNKCILISQVIGNDTGYSWSPCWWSWWTCCTYPLFPGLLYANFNIHNCFKKALPWYFLCAKSLHDGINMSNVAEWCGLKQGMTQHAVVVLLDGKDWILITHRIGSECDLLSLLLCQCFVDAACGNQLQCTARENPNPVSTVCHAA